MSLMPWIDRSAPSGPVVKLTYDDFLRFPEDGKRHELIVGEHHVTPYPNLRHQRILGNLFEAFRLYLREHPGGEVFCAPLDVVLSDVDVVAPDLLYVSGERAKDVLTPEHVRGAPDLVIEIMSKGTRRRDETTKRRLYERAGVNEYWAVEPIVGAIRIYRRSGTEFTSAIELHRDAADSIETPLLPGLVIGLRAIFPD
jgi:Uma2 family endonuclease